MPLGIINRSYRLRLLKKPLIKFTCFRLICFLTTMIPLSMQKGFPDEDVTKLYHQKLNYFQETKKDDKRFL